MSDTVAERKRFLLRISPELFEELNRWAAQELRSVNSQIEYLLQQAVSERRRTTPPSNRAEGGHGPAASAGGPSGRTTGGRGPRGPG